MHLKRAPTPVVVHRRTRGRPAVKKLESSHSGSKGRVEVGRLPLAARISLTATLLAFLAAATLAAFNYRSMRLDLVAAAQQDLRGDAELARPYFEQAFERLALDVDLLRATPPFGGLMRSEATGGIDPFDGSTYEAWRRRLNTIFTATLRVRPDYVTIRLVRNENESPGPVVVATGDRSSQLDGTLEASHFELVSATRAGEVTLAPIRYEAANGNHSGRLLVHALAPIRNADQSLWGALDLTADVLALTADALTTLSPNADNYLLVDTDHGPVVLGHSAAAAGQGSPAQLRVVEHPPAAIVLAAEATGVCGALTADSWLMHYCDLRVGDAALGPRVRYVAAMPLAALAEPLNQRQGQWLAFSAVFVACATLLGLLAGRIVSRPLTEMGHILSAGEAVWHSGALPIHRRDEVGQFARSFQRVLRELDASREMLGAAYLQLKTTIDKSVDGHITMSPHGVVMSFNPACETMFGYRAEEVVGQNIRMLMHDPERDAHDGYLGKYRQSGERHIIGSIREVQGRRRNGSTVYLELSVSRIDLPNGPIFSGGLRDIGERKRSERRLEDAIGALKRANDDLGRANTQLESMNGRLESTNEQLATANRRLEIANEDVRSLAYVISHDLRAPLLNLTGFSGELRDVSEELRTHLHQTMDADAFAGLEDLLESRMERAVKFIGDSAQKMNGQLDVILRLSRLGMYTFNPEPLDLQLMFESVWADLCPDIGSVDFDCDLRSLPVLVLDREAMLIVATNLLSNALKYRSRHRDLEIRVSGKFAEQGLTIAVSDNGRGIAPSDCDRVFALFRRCGRQDTRGEGVGLALTASLISRMNGRIWFDSAPEEGADFYVFLPRSSVPTAEDAPTADSAAPVANPASNAA